MKIIKRLLYVLFAMIASQKVCYAQITLPKVFGDNMVLQRNIKIPVWGNAIPGKLVIAELGSVRTTAKADKAGKWMVKFPKFKAGGPYTLKIYEHDKPDTETILKNILIGDVWVASGQSNMEWQVQQAQDARNEISKANFPQIRFLFVEHDKKLIPQTDISGSWKVCDTTNVKQFSAVAYYFASKLHIDQNIPIGIVQSTWGGTPVESWTSREKLLSSTVTRSSALAFDTLTPLHFAKDSLDEKLFWDIVYNVKNNADQVVTASGYDDSGWPAVEMPRLIKDFGIGKYVGIMWMRKTITLPESFTGKDLTLNLGHPEMNYSLYFNGKEICKTVWNDNPKQSYTIPASMVQSGKNTFSLRIAMLWGGGGLNPPAENIYISDGASKVSLAGKWLYKKDLEPTIPHVNYSHYYPIVLYNAMVHPLIPYGIKGFIWYQGEANDSMAYKYQKMFPLMIADWRERWGQGKLPFLYVQLANYKKKQAEPTESEWAELREAQTMTLSQPNTGMACTIDIGDVGNIHPSNKQEVGRRLALSAEKLAYNQDIIASGPLYKSFRKDGDKIRIRFANPGSELSMRGGNEVTGFAIAGSDQRFYWAKAVIIGKEVIVYSDKVPDPVAVRYAWADNPECNLTNSEGLPAVPFRTDSWKGITEK